MSERIVCGYTVVDKEGTEEPCNRPATSWRWYQDVEHEDLLEAACDWHENEGGRRMHSLTAERDRARAIAAALEAELAALHLHTQVKWRIGNPDGPSYAIDGDHPEAEKWTRRVAATRADSWVERREVTTGMNRGQWRRVE